MTGRRRKPGRMGPFIEGYGAWLAGRGYAPGTIVGMLAMAGGLGRWMDARGLAPGDLDRAAVTEFRDALRAAGMRWVPGAHGPDRLLEYLEDLGVLGRCSSPGTPVEVLAERYRRWLVTDRGLAEATVVRYVKLARSFLSRHLTSQGGLESLSGADVAAFLLAESERLSVGSVKGRVGELRSEPNPRVSWIFRRDYNLRTKPVAQSFGYIQCICFLYSLLSRVAPASRIAG